MVRGRVLASAFGTLTLLAMLVAPAPRAAIAANSAGIAFEVPSVVDPMHAMGEPDIGVDPLGRVFSSGPTGTGTQRSLWYGSIDKGHTYREINPGTTPLALSGTKDAPGGGDTDIAFDRSSKQYFTDLYALTCLRTATTNDGGATANQEVYPAGCTGVPGADRQWLALFDPSPAQRAGTKSAYLKAGGPTPLIYMEYNNVTNGAHWVKSNVRTLPQVPGDPGLTYQDATNGDTSPCTDPNRNTGFYVPFGADGHPSIDQVTGNVFQAEFGPPVNGKASILLNIGTPDAAGNLTFLDAPSTDPCGDQSKLITVATGVPDDSGDAANFVVSAIDSASNIYVAWVGKSTTPALRQAFVAAASPASGYRNWTTVQVSDASIATGDAVNVFPWVAAGGPGRSDVVWYGANTFTDPSTNGSQAWNVFLAQAVFNTNQSGNVVTAAPTVSLVKASPHPAHYDSICLAGTACIASQGNRNLADFFAVTIDGTGAAEIVYDDTSNGLAQPGFTPANVQLVDHAGAPLVTVVRQSAGIGLYGKAVSGPSNTPVGGLNDPAGDALFPVIGGSNQRGMDIRSSILQLSPDGQTLSVTMRVVDLTNPAATAAAITGSTNLQYVTRWQLGNTIYYAAMENTALNQPIFYAGAAQSIDLCSVSACFPHVITYPEPPPAGNPPATFTGKAETGAIICPASPSADNPCSLTLRVKVADIGSPTASSLLEEVGGYTFGATIQEAMENNATAESDTVPLEIDGVCCYNFQASVANTFPPPCHEGDGEGDVSDGHGGTARMRFDADACEDGNPESIQESDSNTGDNFQSDRMTAATYNDALSSVTILGTGTHNGSPVTFTLVAVNGATGIGTYSLVLSDGYSVGGTLLNGSIQLR